MIGLSEEHEQTVTLLVHALDSYVDPAQSFAGTCVNLTPDEKRTASPYEQKMINLAFVTARSYLFFALDHLMALRQVLGQVHVNGLIPIAACHTLIRGCAELSARSSWLTDPDISRQDRVVRAVSECLNTAKGFHTLEKDDPNYDESSYKLQLHKIVGEAKANGVPVFPPKKPGSLSKLKIDRFPSATIVVDMYLRRLINQGESQTWFYSLLSSYVHSATLPVLLDGTPEPPDEARHISMRMWAHVPQIAIATEMSMALHAQANDFFGRMVDRRDAPTAPLHDFTL